MPPATAGTYISRRYHNTMVENTLLLFRPCARLREADILRQNFQKISSNEQNCCCTATEVLGQVQQQTENLRMPTSFPLHCPLSNMSLGTSARTLRTVHAIAILPRRQEARHAMMMRMRKVSLCRLLTRAALRTPAAGIAATSILPAPEPRTQGAPGSHVRTADFQQWCRRW